MRDPQREDAAHRDVVVHRLLGFTVSLDVALVAGAAHLLTTPLDFWPAGFPAQLAGVVGAAFVSVLLAAGVYLVEEGDSARRRIFWDGDFEGSSEEPATFMRLRKWLRTKGPMAALVWLVLGLVGFVVAVYRLADAAVAATG